MPSKLANILAAGRTCVATALPGTTIFDVVNGHETGIVVPPENAPALADAIRTLAGDPERRQEFGLRAKQYANMYLDRQSILQAFEAKLLSLAQFGTEKRGASPVE
jgi:colanic acid biosynthesis glycosyl transferase WcaI